MNGKKKDKFCITLAFACNADGSERLLPIYIGKAKKPQCFKGQTPAQLGLYYQSNKTAWMTSELFEECVLVPLS
jgi:DDE superfamily endonuclease